jgi:hypothetical protein
MSCTGRAGWGTLHLLFAYGNGVYYVVLHFAETYWGNLAEEGQAHEGLTSISRNYAS